MAPKKPDRNEQTRSYRGGSAVTNLTSICEDVGLTPGLTQGLRIWPYYELWCSPEAGNFHML